MAWLSVFNYSIQFSVVLSVYLSRHLRFACGESKHHHCVRLDSMVGAANCGACAVRLQNLVYNMPIAVFRGLAATAGSD